MVRVGSDASDAEEVNSASTNLEVSSLPSLTDGEQIRYSSTTQSSQCSDCTCSFEDIRQRALARQRTVDYKTTSYSRHRVSTRQNKFPTTVSYHSRWHMFSVPKPRNQTCTCCRHSAKLLNEYQSVDKVNRRQHVMIG